MKLNLEKKFAPMLRKLGSKIMSLDRKPAFISKEFWTNRTFDTRWKVSRVFDTFLVGTLAGFNSVFKVKHLPSFPAGENPQKEKDVVYVLKCRMSKYPIFAMDELTGEEARSVHKEDKFTIRVQITGPNSYKFLDGYVVIGKSEFTIDPERLSNVGPVYESSQIIHWIMDMLGEHYGHADYGFAVDSYYKEF
jgi:hypothetical protein